MKSPRRARIARIELRPYRGGGIGNYLFHLCHAVMHAQLERAVLVIPPPLAFRTLNDRTVSLDFTEGRREPGVTEPLGSFIHGDEATRMFSFWYRFHCMRNHVAPLFVPDAPHTEVDDGTLVIHVRGGDIFQPGGSNRKYGQPPLAWYRRLLQDPEVRDVLIVTQARPRVGAANPVVERLAAEDARVRVQSDATEPDFHTLRNARQLALSGGTFAVTAAMTHARLRKLHVPVHPRPADPNFTHVFPRGKDYGFELHTWNIRGYENLARWENRPDQVRTMLEHPESGIVEERDSGAAP